MQLLRHRIKKQLTQIWLDKSYSGITDYKLSCSSNTSWIIPSTIF